MLIKERFTLIYGKFKRNLLNQHKSENFLEILENLKLIPMEKLINILQEESENHYELKNSLQLVDFIHNYRKTINSNIEFTSQYKEILKNLCNLLKFNFLSQERITLQKDLEISIKNKKDSDNKAILDLLSKLNESVKINSNKLKFLNEDFSQYKNQFEQINQIINDYKSKIIDFTKQKKYCFTQINQITREMSRDDQEAPNISKSELSELNDGLTNAEKIRALQKKAKNIQFEINSINSKISQSQLKLETVTPIYESYKNDYEELKELVKTEEQKINVFELELKNQIQDNNSKTVLTKSDLKLYKHPPEIEREIKDVNYELEKIIVPNSFFDSQNPQDLTFIINKLEKFEKSLKIHESDLIITKEEEGYLDSLINFQKFEFLMNNLESLTKKFMREINLSPHFEILINENEQKFYIDLQFIRNDKDQINFDDLTTPEKIFFIIVFYISLKLQNKSENVMFSNLFLPIKYNKAGSIYRTIRKILPIFEREEGLSRVNLIFIFSNLEMKKKIKNLNLTNFEES